MNLKTKILIPAVFVFIILISIPYFFSVYFHPQNNRTVEPIPEDSLPLPTDQFPSQNYTLDEGFQFSLVDGWQLASHTPDRSVDRYRFEKKEEGAVFTVSFYNNLKSFDEVISSRYGSDLETYQTDMKIGGFEAKHVTAAFAGDRTSADVIIKVNDNLFISLYGIHSPTGEISVITAQEINYMQQSFSSAK